MESSSRAGLPFALLGSGDASGRQTQSEGQRSQADGRDTGGERERERERERRDAVILCVVCVPLESNKKELRRIESTDFFRGFCAASGHETYHRTRRSPAASQRTLASGAAPRTLQDVRHSMSRHYAPSRVVIFLIGCALLESHAANPAAAPSPPPPTPSPPPPDPSLPPGWCSQPAGWCVIGGATATFVTCQSTPGWFCDDGTSTGFIDCSGNAIGGGANWPTGVCPPSPPTPPPPPPPAYLTNTEPTGFTLNAVVATLIDRASSYSPLPYNDRFEMSDPTGMVYDRLRNKLIWSNTGTNEIYEVDNFTGTVTKLAGFTDDDGDGSQNVVVGVNATFDGPAGLAMRSDGRALIVADKNNHQIRVIDMVTKNVHSVAGFSNQTCGSADGFQTNAGLCSPFGLALTKDNSTLYISEVHGHRIRKMEIATGTVRMPEPTPLPRSRPSTLSRHLGPCQWAALHARGHPRSPPH